MQLRGYGKKPLICRDAKDNMLLECCSTAKADFLITGDKGLLDIETSKLPKELAKLKIVTPRRFLELWVRKRGTG